MTSVPHDDGNGKFHGWMVDAALGQLGEAETAQFLAALERDPDLAVEFEEVRQTVTRLRNAPALQPSERFRRTLERRLDALEAEESAPVARGGGAWETARFEGLLLAHRVRTSARSRMLAVAAAASLLVGISAAWWWSGTRAPQDESATWQPVAEHRGDTAPPSTPPDELVQQQLRPDESLALDDHVPHFVDAGGSDPRDRLWDGPSIDSELPEGRPRGSGVGPELPRDVLQPVPRSNARSGAVADRGEAASAPGEDSVPETPAIDSPERRALLWLARQQRDDDGSWNPGAHGDPDLPIAVTALATLALVENGYVGIGFDGTDADRQLDRAVRKGVEFLLAQRQENGSFGNVGSLDAQMFNQSATCLALLAHRRAVLRITGGSEGCADESTLRLGLQRLEDQFQRLLANAGRSEAESGFRWEGQNAAWAALALADAQRDPGSWSLDPFLGADIDGMFARLRPTIGTSDATLAAGRAVHAMLRTSTEPERTDGWQDLVDRILFTANPSWEDAGLRFLVASAMVPWEAERDSMAVEMWEEFEARLDPSILGLQHEAGYFELAAQADLHGGDVFDTALCLLTLALGPNDR